MMLKMVDKNHKQLHSIPINTKINSKMKKALRYKTTHFCGCLWKAGFLASFCPTGSMILNLYWHGHTSKPVK